MEEQGYYRLQNVLEEMSLPTEPEDLVLVGELLNDTSKITEEGVSRGFDEDTLANIRFKLNMTDGTFLEEWKRKRDSLSGSK